MHLLPPPPPVDEEYDDRVQCPHCMRKFNATAAERHIPKCSSIRAKPKMLVKGGGGGAHERGSAANTFGAPMGGGMGGMAAASMSRQNGGRTPTQYVL